MSPAPLHLSVDAVRRPDDVVLVLAGEVDLATAAAFHAEVTERLAQGPVVLDLSGLRFMDSSGILALDRILREAQREGWRLTILADLQDAVRAVLDMTGLLDGLPLVQR